MGLFGKKKQQGGRPEMKTYKVQEYNGERSFNVLAPNKYGALEVVKGMLNAERLDEQASIDYHTVWELVHHGKSYYVED